MGKGDKKSRRGKIHIGSHGVRRPQRKAKTIIPVAEPEVVKVEPKPKTPKKATGEKTEAVEAAVEKPKKAVKKAAPKKTKGDEE